nr:hypothetical protein [Tanacetum cinerariifolium]
MSPWKRGVWSDLYMAVFGQPTSVSVASRGWSFAFAVPSLLTHLVTSLTPDSANSCVIQGASCTQRKVSMLLFVLPSILLLVVIVVMVVIIVVISVVVVAIVGVVVVVVGSSVSSINKISLMIVGPFLAIGVLFVLVFLLVLRQRKILEFKTSRDRYENNGMSDPIGGLDTKVASRGWSFAFAVPGLLTHLVTSLTPDSANSCVIQVVVVAIVGVVLVVVGSSVSSINKLSLVIVGPFLAIGVLFVLVFLLVLLVFSMLAACASRVAAMLSATSCRMAA